MQTHNTQNNPWTKGEKLLLGAILLTVALAALVMLWWKQVNTTPVIAIPTPTMPAQNAFDFFNAAVAAEVQKNSVDAAIEWAGPPPTHPAPGPSSHFPIYYTPQQKAALVHANALTLKTLRQGLSYPYQNPPIRSFYTPLPYYAKFRSLARLLHLEGQVRENRGDWGGAANSNLDAAELGEKMPHGGTEIGMLVGVACESIGRRPLWAEVDHLSAAQARAAARRLEQIMQAHVPLADTLQEQEWATQAGMVQIFHYPTWRTMLKGNLIGMSDFTDFGLTPQQMVQLNFAGKRAIMGDYTAGMDEIIRSTRLPYATRAPVQPTSLVAQVMIGDCTQLRLKDTENEAQDALLLTTLALRAYRLEHGAYRATLAPLAPVYLAQIPRDPFAASGPLHYKRQGAKDVLYSIGPDGKDDGGKPVFDASKPAPAAGERDQRYYVMPDSKGDIVAGTNMF